MTTARSTILAAITALALVSVMAERAGHAPSVASLALGTDDAFVVSGLESRENLVGGGVLRWTQPRAMFQFDGVGPGEVDVDLRVRDHRTEVSITANGAIVGTLMPGQRQFASRIRLTRSRLILGIETEGFSVSSGRQLGTQFVSLGVTPVEAAASPLPNRVLVSFALLVILGLIIQRALRLSEFVALLIPLLFAGMVLPAGLWRSPWLLECAVLMGLTILVSALVVCLTKGARAARTALQAALLLTLTIHGVLPPSPLVIQQDVQLHGNKLAEVARGNWFPTTRTDHKVPFEIPYGFSFYGLLSPLASSPTDNVSVVRGAAAFFTGLSILAFGLAVGRSSPHVAATALLLWAFMPANIRTMAYGNLNNIFAQAAFVLFLTGSLVLRPRLARSLFLALLVLLSATAHLGSFIVVFILLIVTFPLARGRATAAFKPLLVGVFLASCYYAVFVPLIWKHVPRLLAEHGGSRGVFDPWLLPSQILLLVGWPLLALIVLAALSSRTRLVLPLGRELLLTGLLLAVAALVSPVEVRYVLALAPFVAIMGGSFVEEAPSTPDGFPPQNLTSVVDFPWLRTLSSDGVTGVLGYALLSAAVAHGASVLRSFLPLFAS